MAHVLYIQYRQYLTYVLDGIEVVDLFAVFDVPPPLMGMLVCFSSGGSYRFLHVPLLGRLELPTLTMADGRRPAGTTGTCSAVDTPLWHRGTSVERLSPSAIH